VSGARTVKAYMVDGLSPVTSTMCSQADTAMVRTNMTLLLQEHQEGAVAARGGDTVPWPLRMLKVLAAELSLGDGQFMPVARTAVVADPAPDAGGRAAGADAGSAARPLPGLRGVRRAAPQR
jgi:hypothetical protein